MKRFGAKIIFQFFILSAFFCLFSCSNHKLNSKKEKLISQRELRTHHNGLDILEYIKDVEAQKNQAVDDFIAQLDLDQKIAQLFVVNLVGCDTFTPVETNIAGGFLYFGYNIAQTPVAMAQFNQSIIDYCKQNNNIPPFLTVDQEGGFVNRLRSLNGPLPSAQRITQNLDVSKAAELYSLQAKQMKALGFTMNLAPVAEVCTPDNEVFLNERSFGNLDQVKQYGTECVLAYEENGVGTVLKHFPGNTNTDPHTGLPQINWSDAELKMQMDAFRTLVAKNPSAVLMSHARVKGYDEKNPACLSEYWVTQVLRKELGFAGIIFSDDIFMGALANNGYPPELAVVAAIQAGIDCIMISEKRIGSSVEVLCKKAKADNLFAKRIDNAVRRIIEYKIKCRFLEVQLGVDGKYTLVINYPEISGQGFDQAREKNIQLYMENF